MYLFSEKKRYYLVCSSQPHNFTDTLHFSVMYLVCFLTLNASDITSG